MPSPAMTTTIRVDLDERSYDAEVGPGLLESLGARCAALFGQGRRAFLVYDADLPDALVIASSRSLAHHGFHVSAASVRAEESAKSLGAVARLLVDLAQSRHERGEPVIALGGGVTGDVAGFLAAIYRRGAPVVQCPTTLLAMVDASVGGKTGVNLLTDSGLKKNLVGAFWQPSLVLADVVALTSLPDRHFRSGLAECLKHGMLGATCGDPGLFDWTVSRLGAILDRDAATLTELVARNIALKAKVVACDEREEAHASNKGDRTTHHGLQRNGGAPNAIRAAGGRALLNLGHTFAHAIETIPGLTPDGDLRSAPLHHGEAVALGLIAASGAAESLGLAPKGLRAQVGEAVAACGLPRKIAGLPPDADLLDAMAHDKKVADNRLHLVLPTDGCRGVVVADPPPSAVAAGWGAIRSSASA